VIEENRTQYDIITYLSQDTFLLILLNEVTHFIGGDFELFPAQNKGMKTACI
jgi:hypothetical protein